MKNKPIPGWHSLCQRIRTHPVVFGVYVVLRLIVIGMLAVNIVQGDYESAFVCGLVLVLFLAPSFIERKLRIEIPSVMECIILLFIFAAEILGELGSYYLQYPYWDTLLHVTNGFLCAAFGFSLVDILSRNKQEKFRLSPFYVALAAFCFSMTVGVVWEFFEYGMDCLFHTDMQKDTVIHLISTVELDPTASNQAVILENIQAVTVNGRELGLGGYLDIGLHDTMADLLVNFVGAVVFSVIGYVYVKQRGRGPSGRFVRHFIPELSEELLPDVPQENAGE
ncbi:MAG: hypothetical protein IJ518_06590 [Clostridia bacterium]|nr:hypothetical protein [Clostridia bacterium]